MKWCATISGSNSSDVGKPLLECAGNLAVQLLPPALEQALIGRIPHQRVLEAVDGFRWLSHGGTRPDRSSWVITLSARPRRLQPTRAAGDKELRAR